MTAVTEAREPGAKDLGAAPPPLVQHFELMSTAPGGVAKLRELILTLAVQGKLVPQDAQDEPASELLKKIRAEKDRLIADGKAKRGKPPAGISQDEDPFLLPSGWEWVRLNSLLQKIGAGSTPLGGRDVYVPDGVKFLRSQNVWNDGLRLDGVAFIKAETHAKMNGTVVLPNDLLFNITGASIGRCAVVPSDFDEANVSQHVTIIRTVMSELNEFLHKVLVSRHVQQTVMDVQVGVSREGLSIAKLGQFLIPLPPLAEQARIVTRVEELMRLCDALEAKGQLEAAQHAQLVQTLLGTLTTSTSPEELADHWQRVATHFDRLLDHPEAIDALEQTILQLAVRGLISPPPPNDQPVVVGSREESPVPLPGTWSYVRLGEVLVDLRYGTAVKCGYEVDGHPVLRIPNLKNGSIDTTDLKFGHLGTDDLAKLALKRGDILIVRSNGSASLVGSMAVVGPESEGYAYAGYLVRARLNSALITPEYLSLAAKTAAFREQVEGPIRTTSGVKNINSTEISRLSFALPPLGQQRQIVAHVESLRRLCADLRQRLSARQTTQAHLAEALINEVA